MSNKDFYRAFEDKHRGSRELIKERFKVYLPFILPLKTLYPDGIALDIGCGRGEWLELLKENNIQAQGIDFDEGMLHACHILNMDVQQGNGITCLKEQSDESFIIISAFHVVEHISFEELQELVQESLRVLKPGGILILETPNPENIKVATENFYLDPTHIKPIPSAQLSFLTNMYGFKRNKIIRLQEPVVLKNKMNINLLDIIGGVSPDYAVVAQKNANEVVLKNFDEIFSKDFGLSLNSLTEKFERRLLNIEAKATQAEAKATQAEANYHALLNSTSWKITKPLRLAGEFLRWFKAGIYHWITFSPTSRPRRIAKKSLTSLKQYINSRPKLKMQILRLLNRFPKLKQKLKQIGQPAFQTQNAAADKISGPAQLSPQAKKIYNDLKNAIEQQKGKK